MRKDGFAGALLRGGPRSKSGIRDMSNQTGPPADPPHILVLCASPIDRCSLTEHLASVGYAVTGTANGWRAWDQASSGRFALAILDLPPDEAPARALVRSLRQKEVHIKLLALVSTDRAMGTPQLDVDHITMKPLAATELLGIVARLIGPPTGPSDRGGGRPQAA